MVKTLRITTILIAVAALGVIIFIAAKGIASDDAVEKFLSTAGIAEQLQAGSAGSKPSDGSQETPLIRQAKAFALRIDPPPPPKPVEPRDKPARTESDRRPKADVSAKFTLVGTSCRVGDEENSWALINEVGKGWHWVRPGEKIGHLIVEKIGDGVVLIRDGSKTYELNAEREKKVDYVKSFTGTVSSDKTVPAWRNAEKTATNVATDAAVKVETPPQTDVASTKNEPAKPQPSLEDAKEEPVKPAESAPEPTVEDVRENIKWLKQIQEDPESLGMTDEEAKELENLGELLKSLEAEVETIESNEPNTADKSGSVEAEPNSTEDSNAVKTEDSNQRPPRRTRSRR